MDAREILARMWIECDPNRAGGIGPDETIVMYGDDGKEQKVPRWHWFLPRADASIKYLADRGITVDQ